MKIAIISDIHGNFEALKAVLSDIKRKKISKIFCLGDTIKKGIHNNECTDLIKNHCEICLVGNCDYKYTINPETIKDNVNEYQKMVKLQSTLSKENIEFLHNLPLTYEFYFSGNLVRLFHAHPESCNKTINNYELNFREKLKMFNPSKFTKSQNIADIAIFGHLHYQFMEKIYNKTLINCGSVGSSGCIVQEDGLNSVAGEINQAHYLVLNGNYGDKKRGNLEISFESVSYDIEKEIETSKHNPEYDFFVDELRNAHYRGLPVVMQQLKDNGFKFED